jgi:hypothetical protein
MRFTSIGIRARLRKKVISFKFFSVCVIHLIVPCVSSKQKKSVIFHLVAISNHISDIQKRERLDEI